MSEKIPVQIFMAESGRFYTQEAMIPALRVDFVTNWIGHRQRSCISVGIVWESAFRFRNLLRGNGFHVMVCGRPLSIL